MISPQMTLGTSNTVTFWAKSADLTPYFAEKFSVYVSNTTTAVASFVKISTGAFVTLPAPGQIWAQYTYTIPASYDNAPVYVAIQCVSDDQFGFLVDDFKVTGTVPCAAPLNGTSVVTGLTAALSWTTAGAFDVSEIKVQLAGAGTPAAANNTGVAVSGLTYNATGLTANTNYEFWIRDECTDGVLFSSWSGPYLFNTNPPACISVVTTVNAPTLVTTNSATLNWAVPTVAPVSYQIEYGVAPYTQGGGGTVVTSATNSLALSGLTVGATYNYFIRSQCTSLVYSAYTAAQTLSLNSANGDVVIYNTTSVGVNGMELTATANGTDTQMGDAIVLAGTARFLRSITASLFSLVVATTYTVTMSIFTDCPTVAGAGVCGSGVGTLFPLSTPVVVNVKPPTAVGVPQDVIFPFTDLNLSSETDNNITVMIKASRNNVFWGIGETPTIGTTPAGETGNGVVTRCGSTGTNNGCGRVFGTIPNNAKMKIIAALTANPLTTANFLNNAFSVSPNPANDIIKISNAENINVNQISITDLNGRTIKTIDFKNVSNLEVNVSELTTGLYFLNINSEKGIVTKKIMKN